MERIDDFMVVGAGIVGLATARALRQRFPNRKITVIEKEASIGRHQTGHNSGVIHAGIYYKPGSYKASLCVQGVRALKAFCQRRGVPYEDCGKVIVATDDAEVPALRALHERGTANGVPGLRMISVEELRELEPHARAVAALYSPETAIVDYSAVSRAMADELGERDVPVLLDTPLRAIHRREGRLIVEAGNAEIEGRMLVNCAGLHADRVASLAGVEPGVRIIPFRGEYYVLRARQRGQELVNGLIYPVPDPQFPFLGVHFTKRIGGAIEAGPNAVLAFAREGYRLSVVERRDLREILSYGGFWRMARRYWYTGLGELARSLSKRAFLKALRKLVPEIGEEDLLPGGSGVRAQAVAPDGSLVDDFFIARSADAIHVLNAPSPAATASIAIAEHIAGLTEETSA